MTAIVPVEKLNQIAFRVLVRELGMVNAIRFVQQLSPGYGNYTAERDELLGNQTVSEIASEIQNQRENRADAGA